jgi:hypothetical protein
MYKLKNDAISLISLDIETLGLCSTAATVSIGAYHIVSIKHNRDRLTADASPEFYEVCNARNQISKGAFSDPSTIKWWSTQNNLVRSTLEQSMFYDAEDSEINFDVVTRFSNWCKDLPGAPVWIVQGADFDIPIINSFLRMYGSSLPGFFRHKICLRTMLMTNPVPDISNSLAHNALSDAKTQAQRFTRISQQSKDLLVDTLFKSAGY